MSDARCRKDDEQERRSRVSLLDERNYLHHRAAGSRTRREASEQLETALYRRSDSDVPLAGLRHNRQRLGRLRTYRGAMVDRPRPLRHLDRYFAAATIAHEYIADLHRQLSALHQDSEQTRGLLRESAAVVVSRMPELTREVRRLELEWGEQELLDPPQADRTLQTIEAGFIEVEPALAALRERQDEIAAQLRRRRDHERRR